MRESDTSVLLSVVIPSLNEEAYIARTLTALSRVSKKISLEIILVDNGSIDQTCEIASKFDVKVLVRPNFTISALRNEGADVSSGSFLAFIDADVVVASDWADELKTVLDKHKNLDKFITGSRCLCPREEGLIDLHWYRLLGSTRLNYINSGHMVVSRGAFNALGGFDEMLVTGEDHDFCVRAKSLGVKLFNSENLRVFHLGYPTQLGPFIKREIWHGMSDTSDLKAFFASRTALIAAIFPILLLLGILGSVSTASITPVIFSILGILIITMMFMIIKFEFTQIKSYRKTFFMSLVYICARSVSLLIGLCKKVNIFNRKSVTS